MDTAAAVVAAVTLVAGLAAGWGLARARGATTVAERDSAVAERERMRAERDTATARLREAETKAAATASRLGALEQAEVALKDTFARLSTEALSRSSEQFLDLADTRFKQAGAPLTETLTKVESQLREIEKERAGAQEALTQQLTVVRQNGEELRRETASLVNALSKPQARGRWGELQLRRCVELAGMTDRCDFTEQTSVSTPDGTLRPDLVVRLVGGKSVVVDSKVTLAAYLEAYEATDDTVREQRLVAHARHLRQHVTQLAAKSYWSQFEPAPEFVVLFVPGDAFLSAALEHDPALLDDAFERHVHIASPTTLISTLRAVAYAWQQDALASNAQKVFELGRELYKRLGVLGGHMDKLGRSLTSAVNTYNGTVGSLEKGVLVTARKLNDLEVVDGELGEPNPVEEPVRTLAAAELIEAAERSRAVVQLSASSELDRAEDYGLGVADRDERSRRTGS